MFKSSGLISPQMSIFYNNKYLISIRIMSEYLLIVVSSIQVSAGHLIQSIICVVLSKSISGQPATNLKQQPGLWEANVF